MIYILENIIAKVAVDKTSSSFDILFSYIVPDDIRQKVSVGQRVLVPFGKGDKSRQAMIMEISDEIVPKIKPILQLVDDKPIISKEMIRLVYWIKEKTFCTYYEALRLVIPSGIHLKKNILYYINPQFDLESYQKINNIQENIINILQSAKNGILDKYLFKNLSWSKEEKELADLVNDKIVLKKENFSKNVQDETVLIAQINYDNYLNSNIKFSSKQKQVLAILEEYKSVSVKELMYFSGVTRVVIDNLEKKNIVIYSKQEVYRTPYQNYNKDKQNIVLNEEQNHVFDGIKNIIDTKKADVALLYGVTGSGKTSVFIKLIEYVIAQNKQVIMLVPEISLTPQTISLFKNMFGDMVAVLHSALSVGERMDEYKRIKNNIAKIAVGTRSAVFAPFENIGMIIIDEEQEQTYKSESSPRYHARDVAKFRCIENNAVLLLASATPSIESYYYAKTNKYKLFNIQERYNKSELPPVYIVDMNDEKEAGNTSILSSELINAIEENLSSGEQTILLLNRRGYNTVVVCSSCKEPVLCPNCSIAMTYHKANNKLLCHCCGFMREVPKSCGNCNEKELNYVGLGTQKAEQQIEEYFPDSRILRMDMDTTMRKNSHEKLLDSFRNREYDIMIGTQMVAKGLDFENVTLVGVLLADQSLYSNDFRAYERTFSLLTQVVGRCGRGNKKGRAFIQTYTPFNDIITMAGEQDYNSFFDTEISIRKAMLYPPFANFCVISFSGTNSNKVKLSSFKFVEIFKDIMQNKYKSLPMRVLGPTPASVEKIAGKYRYKLIIKCIDNKPMRNLLRESKDKYYSIPEVRNVKLSIDMSYYGNL